MPETAEQKADRLGLTKVLLIPADGLRVLRGHALICCDIEGNEVLVRLPTAQEMVDLHVKACEASGEKPMLTMEFAEQIVKAPL